MVKKIEKDQTIFQKLIKPIFYMSNNFSYKFELFISYI